jgi:hypothetical protein
MTIIDKIIAADNMPTPSGGPLKNGVLFNHAGVLT